MRQNTSFAQFIGKNIKKYRLEQLVQQQQYMAIFMARLTGAEQIYQLRLFTLSEELTAQERLILLGQVQQEVSHIAALQHSAIQPILAYGHEQGMMYIVTPFIPARYALANVLSTQGPLDIIRAGYNLELLASALEYAHKHAIIHGNLTASSVFLCPSSDSHPPTLLLTDIGIAHLQKTLNFSNEVLYHTEPTLGQPVASMSDISALGALLYQMLTAHDVLAAEWQEPGKQEIPPLNTWGQDLPMQLDAVIDTALARDPAKGYHSLKALVDAYYHVVTPGGSQKTVGAGLASAQPLQAPTRSQPLTRRDLTVVLAVIGAGVVLGGGGWFFRQLQQGSQVAQGSRAAQGPQGTQGSQATTPPQNDVAPPGATSPQQPTKNGTVIAHTADLPVNHVSTFTIPNSNSPNPGVLIHLPDGRFVAFDSTCTHQGCQVGYSNTSRQLECPCHGAVFDPTRNAAVVAGPAPSPLVPINIHVNADGTIVVVG